MDNSNRKNLIKVAERTGAFFNKYEPQIDDDTLNYYLVGSLAQMLYASANTIEYCDVQNGKIIEIDKKIEVPEEIRERLLLTARQIGDLDIIGVNGYNFGKNHLEMAKNRMTIDGFETLNKRNDQNILNLMCDDARGALNDTVTKDRVCKITFVNGNTVYVASPETIISQKFDRALRFFKSEWENKSDLTDLLTFINGIYKCYDEEELTDRIADAWKEKKGSIPATKENLQEMKKRFINMKNEIEASDEMKEKDISFNNVFRIMAKSIIKYTDPERVEQTNSETIKEEKSIKNDGNKNLDE